MELNVNESQLASAVRHYQAHLNAVRKYQQKNPDKMREKCKRYYDEIKNDPVKYAEYKAKKHAYYLKKKESA